MAATTIFNDTRNFNKTNQYHNKNRNHYYRHNNHNSNHNKQYHNKSNKSKILTYDIKIGERNFCLTSESLNHDAPNFFTAAFFGHFYEAKTTSIFIERDPENFMMIVKYLRGYEIDWPTDNRTSMRNLLEDVKFYGFERLQNLLEGIYENNFPEKVIPWKILTYTPENEPVVAVNIKDVELERWDSQSLIYNTNPISETEEPSSTGSNDDEDDDDDPDENTDHPNDDAVNEDSTNDENDDDGNRDVPRTDARPAADDHPAADENDENHVEGGSESNDETNPNIMEPNPEKGLYQLEVHGRNALATANWNMNTGLKFENFVLKDSEEEATFRVLTESFRTPEGSLTLTPSLKLSFLKDACIELNGSKYYDYKALSDYIDANGRVIPLYFEEIVVRIDGGVFLMRARAWTIPFYYASQPFVHSVQSSRKGIS